MVVFGWENLPIKVTVAALSDFDRVELYSRVAANGKWMLYVHIHIKTLLLKIMSHVATDRHRTKIMENRTRPKR